MRIPETLSALVDHGIIERVVRPLMSGKEAQIHLIESGGEQRVAKVYKESQERTFQNRADYTEGRKVRNSRDQRAMDSRSKHGRSQNEAAWKTAEVDMIYRLRTAGVRVPEPYNFIDGVLIMELVKDADGFPAPRLGDLTFEPEEATRIFQALLAEVVRMLCAGVVHGDLSDFNVLLSADGPVIIDFPQAVDASSNQNARKLLLRDVDNLHRFHAKFAPNVPPLPYAQEMWELYQRNALAPDTQLTGKVRGSRQPVSTESVLGLIADADRDERRRREKLGLDLRGTAPEARHARIERDPRTLPRERAATQPEARRAQNEAPRTQGPGRPQFRPRPSPPREPERAQHARAVEAPRTQQQARAVEAPRAQQARAVEAPRVQRGKQSASKWGERREWKPERGAREQTTTRAAEQAPQHGRDPRAHEQGPSRSAMERRPSARAPLQDGPLLPNEDGPQTRRRR